MVGRYEKREGRIGKEATCSFVERCEKLPVALFAILSHLACVATAILARVGRTFKYTQSIATFAAR